jgi:hypothetical protein
MSRSNTMRSNLLIINMEMAAPRRITNIYQSGSLTSPPSKSLHKSRTLIPSGAFIEDKLVPVLYLNKHVMGFSAVSCSECLDFG